MAKKTGKITVILLILLLLGGWLLYSFGCRRTTDVLSFGGGPETTVIGKVASQIVVMLSSRFPDWHVELEPTGGSLSNLIGVDRHKLAFGLASAADSFLASRGEVKNNLPPLGNVRALARLYGSAAHLVVRSNSSIVTLDDLVDKRVAVGNPGSAGAQTAKRYFQELGMWERIRPIFSGPSQAMGELMRSQVDAVWQQSGLPSETLQQEGDEVLLRFLDLQAPALQSGLFERLPFYHPSIIPAGTYVGQHHDVPTFEDGILWVCREDLDEEMVYQGLVALFSAGGLQRLRATIGPAADLRLEKGLQNVEIPLHPGALRFWTEQGMKPVSRLRAQPN